ncbi:TlpA family protein disulfide reductase [Kineothrix sp. MB12-C1]|uniref:TlpA family protein disulfide reductase n=1 Tax=Kineothrix sp. MB12-C1 TaxID=3070215 RepID=UPI0027D24E94|nr:TlpA disulfide reductase family protein [Kineothrix sp. MB12-C1]WMC93729.1 TlpA disulfide reductase family protein [Kineothrix sp. MB12-C1]
MKNQQGKAKKSGIWIVSIVFLAMALFLLFFMLRTLFENEIQSGKEERKKAVYENQAVHLFQKMPDIVLEEEDGKEISPLKQGEGISVFLFWASYCPYCQESVEKMDILAQTAKSMGARFFAVDRLDGEKETKEKALHILEEKHVQTKTLFDKERKAYKEIGLNMVPTLLVTDNKGRIIAMSQGSTPTERQLQNMISEAKDGKAFTYSKQLLPLLMTEEGGIRTNYKTSEESIPSGEDILSESQGILMEYAALTGNKEMFDHLWTYTKSKMFPEGFMPWVISEKTDTAVNALVDDLRIIGAIQKAEIMQEENLAFYQQYLDAVFLYNTEEGRPVDFYDIKMEQKADRFTLCYGDMATLEQMKKNDKRYLEVYENTLDLIQNGRISEKFPLYYSYYDYTKQKYEGTRLNMAEAMTTLLHLAEVGELPDTAMDWIADELEKGCVYAAYDIDGSPSEDGYYESTSVYALIVMTALEEGREDIAGKAINKMEQFRIADAENEFYGIFGGSDGTGIYSFDQGMALLAYEYYERMTE